MNKKEETALLKQFEKDIEKGNFYANWSFVGIIFPIAGWILGAMSLQKSGYEVKSRRQRMEISNIQAKAWWGIALSTIAFISIVSIQLYNISLANEADQQEAVQQQAKDSQIQADQTQKQTREAVLDACLALAEQRYSDSFSRESKSLGRTDDTLPADSATRWDNFLKEWKDDCYNRAAVQ